MELRDMQEVIKGIKFLNYVFELRPCGMQGVSIHIYYDASDTRNRSVIAQVQAVDHFYPDSIREPAHLVKIVHDMIMQSLRHEVSELFFINGNDVYNEHKNQSLIERKIINEMFKTNQPELI